MSMKRIGVLVSGSGSNLQSLIDSINNGYINARLSVVISNKKDAYALERARDNNIPAIFVDRSLYGSIDEFNKAIIGKLQEYNVELVVLAGYLYIISKEFVDMYKNRLINIHPSLIPSFCGMGYYGKRVHKAVLEYGAKITGATVHFVDEEADTGPIILQEPVLVMDDDDIETLAQRVLAAEHRILVEAVKLWVDGNLNLEGRRVLIKKQK